MAGIQNANNSKLTEDFKKLAINEGSDLVGIASIDRFSEAPEGHKPNDILPKAQSVIVVAIQVTHTAFDFLPESRPLYTIQFYSVNERLNYIAWRLTRYSEMLGYRALPIPCRGYADKKLHGIFSHKHAMVMSGLGTFGLHNLIITPQYGARIRIVSVFTEANLIPDPMLAENLCKKYRAECGLVCIKDCPAEAISEDGYVDKFRCQQYSKGVKGKEQHGSQLMCGMCIKSCDIGRPEWSLKFDS